MASFSINDFKVFLFQLFRERFQNENITSAQEISDNFDLIGTGLIDSLDFLTMAGELESQFKFNLDFSNSVGEISTIVSFLFKNLKTADGHSLGQISLNDFQNHLQKLGIKKGDNLLVHSSLFHLNKFEKGEQGILDVLLSLIGEQGTLFVPAANSPQFQNDSFNRLSTPVQASLGVFSEFVRKQKESIRSGNPFDSLCGLGHYAYICDKNNIQSHGKDSPWREMLLLPNMKQILLGTTFDHASIVHDAETEIQVPYRFWKTISGKTSSSDNLPNIADFQIYAREMGKKFFYDRIRERDDFKCFLKSSQLERGEIIVSDLKDIYSYMMTLLKTEPQFYLE